MRLNRLSVVKSDEGTVLALDGFELGMVTNYELKSSTRNEVELTVKMLVEFPFKTIDQVAYEPVKK